MCSSTRDVINQIRAFLLGRGIAVRQGQRFLRAELPTILGSQTDALSPRMMRMIEDLAADRRWFDQRIERLTGGIAELSLKEGGAKRLMSVPGVGPVISTAVVAAIGDGDGFSKGNSCSPTPVR